MQCGHDAGPGHLRLRRRAGRQRADRPLRLLLDTIADAGWRSTSEDARLRALPRPEHWPRRARSSRRDFGLDAHRRALGRDARRLYARLPRRAEADPRHRRDARRAALRPFCVASSSQPERIRLSLTVTGLWPRSRSRIFSAPRMVARGKPAPDLFLHAADSMGYRSRSLPGRRGQPGRHRGGQGRRHAGGGLHRRLPCQTDRAPRRHRGACARCRLDDMRDLLRLTPDRGVQSLASLSVSAAARR